MGDYKSPGLSSRSCILKIYQNSNTSVHRKPVSARRARIGRTATEAVAMAAIYGATTKAWLLAHILCLSLSARAAAGGGGGGGFDVLVGAGGLGFVGIGHGALGFVCLEGG
ncbi:hypothetical protein FB451DRAFT_1255086 [Mycena latifolia]|nr:hypothetical protein FB451DRAFT_1255086 [Mycena latifolia]